MQALITSLQSVANTGGDLPGNYRVTITRNGTLLMTFTRTPDQVLQPMNFEPPAGPATYVATATRLNTAGQPIGPSVSATLVVQGPDSFDAPAALTLS